MIDNKKLKRYLMKPHIGFLLVTKYIFSYFKTYRYKLLNPRSEIKMTVRFNQKTILSGRGRVKLCDNVRIGYKIGGWFWNSVSEFQARYPDSRIIIEKNVAINNSCLLIAANEIFIDEETRIGANVTMLDFEAHGVNLDERNKVGEIGRIRIGKNVWIGNSVIILKNVFIGDGSIVAAGSVVLKGNYPANSIIGGNPARTIKQIS